MRKIHVRELSAQEGDRATTMTIEEAKDLEFKGMITVLPDGAVVKNWDELLTALTEYPEEEEPVVYRFPALVGG